MHTAYVYIVASKRNGTLYIGVTSDLIRRIKEHKNKINTCCFTACYNVSRLVYFEEHSSIVNAIEREKYLKNRTRKYKLALIENINPTWRDLCHEIF